MVSREELVLHDSIGEGFLKGIGVRLAGNHRIRRAVRTLTLCVSGRNIIVVHVLVTLLANVVDDLAECHARCYCCTVTVLQSDYIVFQV